MGEKITDITASYFKHHFFHSSHGKWIDRTIDNDMLMELDKFFEAINRFTLNPEISGYSEPAQSPLVSDYRENTPNQPTDGNSDYLQSKLTSLQRSFQRRVYTRSNATRPIVRYSRL